MFDLTWDTFRWFPVQSLILFQSNWKWICKHRINFTKGCIRKEKNQQLILEMYYYKF